MPALTSANMVESGALPLLKAVQPGRRYLLHGPGSLSRPILILDTRRSRLGIQEAYVSFIGQDKRLDTWIPVSDIGEEIDGAEAGPSSLAVRSPGGTKRRKLDKPLLTPTRLSFTDQTGHRPPAETASAPSTPEREHAAMTRVRNFEDVRFGEYLIRTWYYSPYPFPPDETPHTLTSGSTPHVNGSSSKRKATQGSVSGAVKGKGIAASRSMGDPYGPAQKGGEGARGRLWVCDLCFKYMRTRAAWERHSSGCQQFLPPGRRVYQRGSYTIWEVDGSTSTLYCQNLSLFGKLFIDHKSVFFHVENFLFYIICDASTSYRDQPMAFFSKEKVSFDDYNLACIVTFPPFQGNGFGKLLIEFSYHLTRHPSTRSPNSSPGTPERPLSDLGMKGYLAYWSSTILRYLRQVLADAPLLGASGVPAKGAVGKGKVNENGRTLRRRSSGLIEGKLVLVRLEGARALRLAHPAYKGQYSLILTLGALATACHLRVDDTIMTLTELGLLRYRRTATVVPPTARGGDLDADLEEDGAIDNAEEQEGDDDEEEMGEWKDVEVVISREEVERLMKVWGVRDNTMLDPQYVLL